MRLRRAPIDLLLLLMTLIWGGNYSIVKVAFREFPPLAFNGLRMVIASALFLTAMAVREQPRISRRDVLLLAAVGFVGHFAYQLCFIGGLARTSVANSSLILGCSPVAVMMLSALAGQERVSKWDLIGSALSIAGIYLVVGRNVAMSPTSLTGDLLTIAGVICWAIYTVSAGPLLTRLSPLSVTGISMAFGTLFFLPVAAPQLRTVDWSGISAGAWLALWVSAVFALCFAYWIWYAAVQQIGNSRTVVYSNMVPVVALGVAVFWLGEKVDPTKLVGVGAVVAGVAFTRFGNENEKGRARGE